MWELSCNHSIRGGFSGVETLGEVQEMIRRTLKFYPSIQSEDIRTILVHRGDRILPELSARLSEYAAGKLQKYITKLVACRTGRSAENVLRLLIPNGQDLQCGEFFSAINHDLIIYVFL